MGLLEFTNRQVLITRVYADRVWGPAAATHLLYCMTIVFGVILILSNIFEQRPAFHIVTLTFLPVLFSAIRSSFRLIGVTEALPAGIAVFIAQPWLHTLLTIAITSFYIANFLPSLYTH